MPTRFIVSVARVDLSLATKCENRRNNGNLSLSKNNHELIELCYTAFFIAPQYHHTFTAKPFAPVDFVNI